MTKEISLEDYLKILKSGWKLFVITPILAMLLSTLYSTYFTKPVFEATAKVLVQKKSNMQFNNVHTVGTYVEIATGKDMGNKLNKQTMYTEYGVAYSVKPQGEVLYLTADGHDAKKAAQVANAASSILIEEAREIDGMDILKVIEKADVPSESMQPGKARGLIGAGILGLLLAFGLVTIRGFLAK